MTNPLLTSGAILLAVLAFAFYVFPGPVIRFKRHCAREDAARRALAAEIERRAEADRSRSQAIWREMAERTQGALRQHGDRVASVSDLPAYRRARAMPEGASLSLTPGEALNVVPAGDPLATGHVVEPFMLGGGRPTGRVFIRHAVLGGGVHHVSNGPRPVDIDLGELELRCAAAAAGR